MVLSALTWSLIGRHESYHIVSRSGVVACLGGYHIESKVNIPEHEAKNKHSQHRSNLKEWYYRSS